MIELVEPGSWQEQRRRAAQLAYKFMNPPNAVPDNGIDLGRKRRTLEPKAEAQTEAQPKPDPSGQQDTAQTAEPRRHEPWESVLHLIIKTACRFDNLKRADLLSGSRKRKLVRTRRKIAYVALEFDYSFSAIGISLYRHHTSVIHGQDATEDALAAGDEKLAAEIDVLRADVEAAMMGEGG